MGSRPQWEFRIADDFVSFDSRKGEFSKWYRDGRKTIRLVLTPAERDTLFELLASSGFYDAPHLVGSGSHVIPNTGSIQIEATAGHLQHLVGLEEPGLFAFMKALYVMFERRPEYRALPRLNLL